MSDQGLLECQPIQDTLFGDPQVATVENGIGPEEACLCFCSCRTSAVKVGNSSLNSAALWATRAPQP